MHLDLISFPRPVCIQEVRVIPAGHRVHAAVSEREKMGYVTCDSRYHYICEKSVTF